MIGREALTNASQHSDATQLEIVLHYRKSRFEMLCCDDGQGFDVAAVESKSTRWGLLGMQERVKRLGGRFHIQSVPGKGTTISASFPAHQIY